MDVIFFERICSIASETCGIERNMLLSSNRLECVDARVIVVSFLVEQGETEGSVSRILDISQQRVNYLKNSIRTRMKRRRFRRMLEDFNKEVTKYIQETI